MIEMKDYDKFSSFDEFYNSIDTGLDIVFSVYGVKYNISWDNKPFICTCPDGVATFFDSTQDLIDKYKICGMPIKDLWGDIEVYTM